MCALVHARVFVLGRLRMHGPARGWRAPSGNLAVPECADAVSRPCVCTLIVPVGGAVLPFYRCGN